MPTKVKELRAPIESGSISDVILHFLFMFSKTTVYGNPTAVQLYEMNKAKYKNKGNFQMALARLVKMKLITSIPNSKQESYQITSLGVDAINKLAMCRKRKNSSSKSRSTSFRWDRD